MSRLLSSCAALSAVFSTIGSTSFAQQSPPPLPAPAASAPAASPPVPTSPYREEPPAAVSPRASQSAVPVEAPSPKEDVPSTLFDPSRDYAIGAFGGFNMMYSRIAGSNALMLCGEGAVIIDHALTFGGGGCANAEHADASAFVEPGVKEPKLHLAYGGGIIRYHFLSRSMVNVAIGALVGAGGVVIFKRDAYTGDHSKDYSEYSSEAVFVVEPQFGVYLNITRWARVGLAGGYRFVSNVDTKNMTSSDLSGPMAGVNMHAGWF